MPASRSTALPDKLNSRSYTGNAFVYGEMVPPDVDSPLIMTSNVLPAAINTSLLTLGMPGRGLPSSAMILKPVTMGFVPPVAPATCDPTIAGTCIREPALTRRTNTDPVVPVAGAIAAGVIGKSEAAAAVLLNATPLIM